MFNDVQKVTIIGIGGGAAYYVAKFFSLLNVTVKGFDVKGSEHTKELTGLGIVIDLKNPERWNFTDSDLIIYTNALPKEYQRLLFASNVGKRIIDAGTYYEEVVKYYQNHRNEKNRIVNAIRVSDIAPLYDIDFRDIILVGVTGSKGKTTTSQVLYDALHFLGAKVSLVNTIGGKILGESVETGLHTSTPSAQELAPLFRKMIEKGSKIIIVEASSHAIATGRIAGLKFDYAVLTNLQPEHLDFHKTVAHVIETKKQLVTTYLKKKSRVLLNIDDDNIRELVYPDVQKYTKNISTISLLNKSLVGADSYFAQNLFEKESSIDYDLVNHNTNECEHFEVPFAGKFNAVNVFASIIIARELGYANIDKAILQLPPVSGRNEIVQAAPFKVILDFAHTPESLEEILRAYKVQATTKKIIVVFGAAGQRDSSKRARMGQVAAKYADITILTIEDPRTEKVSDINDQIEMGWREYVAEHQLGKERVLYRKEDISLDEQARAEAIRYALSIVQTGDVIICAGKGPEKSMCIGFVEKPWNERAIIESLLRKMK
ncbi:UDP-N-acetylmuramyl-tripeptide synthetase [bacterium]|nr:UDP-N-acetylmuramyl-tripeptide synthetase [bacterium]